MRFLIDAQLPPSLVEWLAKEFSVEATAVRDLGLREARDREIFDLARQENAVVLTKDSDFVELVFRLGAPPRVIWSWAHH
jgi:predicted nuclease of predicted toxin-antitoxin system